MRNNLGDVGCRKLSEPLVGRAVHLKLSF
jgi:hypothetical protein